MLGKYKDSSVVYTREHVAHEFYTSSCTQPGGKSAGAGASCKSTIGGGFTESKKSWDAACMVYLDAPQPI